MQIYQENNNGNSNKRWKKIYDHKINTIIAVVVVSIAFGLGVFAGGEGFDFGQKQEIIKGADAINATSTVQNISQQLPDYLKKNVDFNLYWNVWSVLKDNYINKDVPDTKLFYGSLAGLVASLEDPYSVFMTPTDADEFQNDLSGNFEGIGAEIALKNNTITITAPLPDTPAYKAGLRPKDIVLKINGSSTEDMSLDKAVSLIRGPKESKVKLTIYREGSTKPLDFEITREAISVKSVSWEIKDNVAVLKLRQFNNDTMPLFEQFIDQINQKKINKVVLDLRNNPGGYLQTAVDVAGEWLGNQVIVSEKQRDGQEIKHEANNLPRLKSINTVVLVNGGSASASEIVAGALQDYGLAKIIGEKTFGKGSVQEIFDLQDGSSIKLTVAKWFTPKGRSINDSGIEPDVKVELSEQDFDKDNDPQMAKAMELLK